MSYTKALQEQKRRARAEKAWQKALENQRHALRLEMSLRDARRP